MKKILILTILLLIMTGMTACGDTSAAESLSAGSSSSVEDTPQSGTTSDSGEKEDQSSPSSETSAAEEPAASQDDPSDSSSPSIMIAYFSWSGNTRTVAEKIQAQTSGDLFEILTVQEYPHEYSAVLEQAQAEQRSDARPELKEHVENMADYDILFLGYPNWSGDMPMALYSFLEEYDLSGKTIAPFVTSGSSGFSDTMASIKEAQPDAVVADGLSVLSADADSCDEAVSQWLDTLDLT